MSTALAYRIADVRAYNAATIVTVAPENKEEYERRIRAIVAAVYRELCVATDAQMQQVTIETPLPENAIELFVELKQWVDKNGNL